jgi:hypothetical protein
MPAVDPNLFQNLHVSLAPFGPATLADAAWLQQEADKFKANNGALIPLLALADEFVSAWVAPASFSAGSLANLRNAYHAVFGSSLPQDAPAFSANLQAQWKNIAHRLSSYLQVRGALIPLTQGDAQALRDEASRLESFNLASFDAAVADLGHWTPNNSTSLLQATNDRASLKAATDAIHSLSGDAAHFRAIAAGIDALLQQAQNPAAPIATAPSGATPTTTRQGASPFGTTTTSTTTLVLGTLGAVGLAGAIWWWIQKMPKRPMRRTRRA